MHNVGGACNLITQRGLLRNCTREKEFFFFFFLDELLERGEG